MNSKRFAGHARRGRSAVYLLTGLALGSGANLVAQEQGSPKVEEVDEVVVTGSRIKRDVTDASTPLAIINAEEIKLSGSPTIDKVLSDQPQFVQATNGGATANTVPAGSAAGAAYVNLRGFGPTRSLTLVNGRRYAIFGPEQITDLNTIPTALIERTEVVTGGSSAVYGSDAITGVVNFIMKDDFEGVQVGGQYGFDSSTSTPTTNVDLTLGGNFAEGRGNAVVSLNYYKREGFTRDERGDWAKLPYGEGCVTAASWSDSLIGVANGASAANCEASGGKMGFVFSGSGDIPNGRFTLTPAQMAAAQGQLATAGLAGLGANGFTFNDAGALGSQRLVNRPADDFNLTQFNYLQVPQERWMLNAFTHYDFADKATGYLEFHFSNNRVDQQLTQANIGGDFLINTNNPYVDASMRAVLAQLDTSETGPRTIQQGPIAYTTTPGDGLAIITAGRRLVELPFRHNVDDHNVWRVAAGFKGDLGSVSESFLRDLSYDAYYSFARSEDSSRQEGAASRSRYAASLLSVGAAAPVSNIFGQNLSAAAVNAIKINATNTTNAEQKMFAATLGGVAFDLPAGAVGFSIGAEWRKAEAEYIPDEYLRSGDVIGFNPGLPTAGDVTSKDYFAEVRIPILADVPLIKNLTANGGYRSSDYDLDGVGRVSSYLYGLDWRLNESVGFRGQFQRAIRAPNIGDLYGGLQLNFQTLTDPCSSRAAAASQTAAVRAVCEATGVPPAAVFTAGVQPDNIIPTRSGGNVNLQEESSDTRTFGVVFTPEFLPELAVTLDYFDITLDGAIAQLGGGAQNTLNLCYLTVQDASSDFCQAVHRNTATGGITVPFSLDVLQANIGALETSGIDLNARYGWDVGWGGIGSAEGSRFTVSTAWTHTDEFTVTPMQAVPQNKNRCVGAYGSTCGEPIPELKGVTRFTWTTGPLGVSLRHRYIDSVTSDRYVLPKSAGLTPPLLATLTNPKFDAQNYIDLSFTYDFGDKAEIYAGVNNVLDSDPPIVAGFGGYGNTFPATYDYAGMTIFLGVTVKTF
ncbi:MAG TPA: TonB-dependent receptor [Steroidobacteraceae bacterium]|jgi:outer membrane receptor protein involved in Fe transport|nr:TonB-dependent receptor [Steroidobacteraceae bacterium]